MVSRTWVSVLVMLQGWMLQTTESVAKPSVVSTTTVSDEILYAIRYPHVKSYSELVADERYSNIASFVKKPGNFGQNLEHLIRSKPDLVIVSTFNRPATLELIARLKLPSIKLPSIDRFDQLWQVMTELGKRLESSDDVRRLIESSKERLALPKCPEKTGFLYSPDFIIPGRMTMVSDIFQHAGIHNIADREYAGWRKMNAEAIKLWNPDVVVVSSAYSQVPFPPESVIVVPEALLSATSPFSVETVSFLRRSLCGRK